MRLTTTITRGLTLLVLAALLLAACAPAAAPTELPPAPTQAPTGPAPPTTTGTPTADPNQAVTSPPNLGTAEPDPNATAAPWVPQPGDADWERGNVYLDVTALAILESYPIQVVLRLEGNRPTPCHAVRVAVAPPDKRNQIAIEVYTVVDPGQACTQVLAPFNENIPLGSFPAGDYTVIVNGTLVGEFTA